MNGFASPQELHVDSCIMYDLNEKYDIRRGQRADPTSIKARDTHLSEICMHGQDASSFISGIRFFNSHHTAAGSSFFPKHLLLRTILFSITRRLMMPGSTSEMTRIRCKLVFVVMCDCQGW